MGKTEDAHHVIPRFRGGGDDISNIIYVDQYKHHAYHRLFSSCTPEEILGVIKALHKLTQNPPNGCKFNLVTLVEILRNREQGWFSHDGVDYIININQDDFGKRKYKKYRVKKKILEDGVFLFENVDLWHIASEIKKSWINQDVFETSKSA